MKVIKFGGSSVGSAEGLTNVKKIVEEQQEQVLVVVSALGGITDKLIACANLAAGGDIAYKEEFKEICDRHEQIAQSVLSFTAASKTKKALHILLDELDNIYQSIYLTKEITRRMMDIVVSYGERLSSLIVSELIGDSELFDSRDFIKTEFKNGTHVLNSALTNTLIKETFRFVPKHAVVSGFISSDTKTGDATNLGRGGSDYTAAILAAALDASVLEIWTDVDGFMTADPRVIKTAYTISELSYNEASELCNFGAKVIYPPTIYPVCSKNIPIKVKNTFNPKAKGSVIVRELQENRKSIKGISSINNTALINVHGLGMIGVVGTSSKLFKTLADNNINAIFVSQASSENCISVGVLNQDADLACTVLNNAFASEIEQGTIFPIKSEKNLAIVAIVGENMRRTPGIAGKLFGVLGRNGINVIACAQGASETNISFVVESQYLRKSLNVIHDSFFLSEFQELNLFVCGIGTVGGSLLEQICMQQEKLKAERGLKINVVGIARGGRAMFDRNGIDLSNYKEALENAPVSDIERLRSEVIGMNIFNSVFVDCTASAQVAELYKDFLNNHISVVAANKIAASSEYSTYAELKQIARKRGVKFLFETNVGAGLPVINTINDLINSGDRILKIEAVVSGTLNFIFNEISAATPLSRTIQMAKEQGYSEPDPRIDLSGKDVIRKLVILARESGYRLEQDDIEKNLFIPQELFDGPIDEFWAKLPELDAEFEEKRKVLESQGKRWRFVAKLQNGKGSVSLESVDSTHPFYNLQGSNNIILLTTERYKEYPMMIQGYGAGAAVTAAGVFADIMSIANI